MTIKGYKRVMVYDYRSYIKSVMEYDYRSYIKGYDV